MNEPRRAQRPAKYAFDISGDPANQPIPPQDAALMQSTETTLLGQTLKGDEISDMVDNQGMTAVETNLPGGQILGKVTEDVPRQDADVDEKITIGEAASVVAAEGSDQGNK